jgi:hypothetical protein
MTKTFLSAAMAGLFGGFLGAYLLLQLDRGHVMAAPPRASTMRASDVLSAGRIRLTDANGKVRAELALSIDGGPALFFYDSAGRNRLVLGLYSAAENEAPSVVLNDDQQHAAGIFRLFGPHDTPVVVLKNQGRDRSVYGLDPASADPYLANYTGGGVKSDVFGNH